MKLKMKLLAAVAVMAVAGQASAAITLGSVQGGSSLFLSVWDATTNESYIRNLGVNLNAFLPSTRTTLATDGNVNGTPITGDKTPDAGLNLLFAGDSLFTSTFGNNDAANINWNIVAFDNQSSAGSGLSRVITTAAGAPGTTNAGIGLIGGGGTNYLSTLIQQTTLGGASNSVVVTDPSSAAFAGAGNWDVGLNGGLNGSSAGAGYASQLGFYYLARSVVSGSNSALATQEQFGNTTGFATWTLDATGAANYVLAGEVAAVPVPAAVWMLGSGLIGLFGAARRRKAISQS